MAKLYFKNEGLKRLVAICDNATEYKHTYMEAIKRYEAATGRKFNFKVQIPDKYYVSEKPSLWLVKDEGIYIMTNARMETPPENYEHVVYAVGYDPRASDVYDKCREAVGGDDFGEAFALTAELKKGIAAGFNLCINFTPEYYDITLVPNQLIQKQ